MVRLCRKASTPWLWHLLLRALCWVTICTGSSSPPSDSLLTDIVIPSEPLPFEVCWEYTANVEFMSIVVEGTKYTRTVLDKHEFVCLSAGSAVLDAESFQSCAKNAYDQGYNAFYFDDQGQCVGSNQPLADDAGLPYGEGDIVYIAENPTFDNVYTAPEFEYLTISNVAADSFDVNFYPACFGFAYDLRSDGQSVKTIQDPDTVTSSDIAMPPCSDIPLTLQATAQGTDSGNPATAVLETLPVPGVTNVSVDTFILGQSFNVHFTATCPDDYTFVLELDGQEFTSVVTGRTETHAAPPCTSLTPTIHVHDSRGRITSASVTGQPTTTPDTPDVDNFSVESQGGGSYLVSFALQCNSNVFTYYLEVEGEPSVAVDDGDTVAMSSLAPCTGIAAKLVAKQGGSDVGYAATINFTSEPVPTVNSFSVNNLIVDTSFDVVFDAVCPESYQFEVTVGQSSCKPVQTGGTCSYPIPGCDTITQITLNVLDGGGLNVNQFYAINIVTPAIPDVDNFVVSKGNTMKTFIISFKPKCPRGNYIYEIQAQGDSFVVDAGDTVTLSSVTPCSTIQFALLVKSPGDTDVLFGASTSVDSLPDPTILSAALVNAVPKTSVDISFTPKCPTSYTFNLQIGGQTFNSVKPGDTIGYDVPPCSTLNGVLHVIDNSRTVASETLPPFKTPGAYNVNNFRVTREGASGKYKVNFDKVCPNYPATYRLKIEYTVAQSVQNGDTVCPQLEFKLETLDLVYSTTTAVTPSFTCN